MGVFHDECLAAGLDPKVVNRLASRLSSLARDAEKLGLTIFGGSGHGSLRASKTEYGGDYQGGKLVVASVDGANWDGGDGGYCPGPDGLNRGES